MQSWQYHIIKCFVFDNDVNETAKHTDSLFLDWMLSQSADHYINAWKRIYFRDITRCQSSPCSINQSINAIYVRLASIRNIVIICNFPPQTSSPKILKQYFVICCCWYTVIKKWCRYRRRVLLCRYVPLTTVQWPETCFVRTRGVHVSAAVWLSHSTLH